MPKIAFIDIETSPLIIAAWSTFDANAIWVERNTHLLSFAVLWGGHSRIRTYALPDYPGYAKDRYSDAKLAAELHRVFTAADIVVAHNGDKFDIKKINARLAVHGFPPPPPFKSIDTLKIARSKFKFDSNKLDHLAQYFGIGRKLPHVGKDMWRGCLEGDPRMWAMMRRYNAHDVWLLEKVYSKLKAWGPHPDMRAYGDGGECPTCLSINVQRRGMSVARSRQYQRLHCQSCGAWFQGERIKC